MPDSNATVNGNTKAKDFRIIFSNSFSFQFSGHDLILKFGIACDPANPEKGMEEQVGVALTPVGMKALGVSLMQIVQHQEKSSNAPIPVAPQVMEAFEKALKTPQQNVPKK
jgi:hypothetical protein